MLDTSEIYSSKLYGDFEVLEYQNATNVTIRFLSTGYTTRSSSSLIRSGNVKDRLYPSVYGVGFIGEGKYDSKGIQYRKWVAMLERCYSEKFLNKFPTYKDCSVDPVWHNFQVFAEWFDQNYIDGYELDKDIKIKGNKIYSPSTCMFVSHEKNVVAASEKEWIILSPEGKKVTLVNMSKFCRENDLHQGHMSLVANGKRKSHKGWRKG